MNNTQTDSEEKKWVIIKCVEKWAQEINETDYEECCRTFSQNSMPNDIDIKTIRRFLYSWGGMGRVLGQEKHAGWEKSVESLISSNCNVLEELRKTNFAQITIEHYEKRIKEIYRSFFTILGPIAAVKTMHLICPNFFPLWDNPIAAAFRNEHTTTKKIADFSAEDYYEFMKDIKDLIEKYHLTISMLAAKYNAGELRIIDQFAWWITHRPLSLLK